MVHFKRVCGCDRARFYEARIFKNGCYENRDKWSGGFNVHIQGKTADVSLLGENYSAAVHTQLKEFCRSEGTNRLRWERRGKEKTLKL